MTASARNDEISSGILPFNLVLLQFRAIEALYYFHLQVSFRALQQHTPSHLSTIFVVSVRDFTTSMATHCSQRSPFPDSVVTFFVLHRQVTCLSSTAPQEIYPKP